MLSYILFDYSVLFACVTRIKSGKVYVTEHFTEFVRRSTMDRRQQKTRQAIFSAFSKLLAKKNYNHITVQEIIDEANIGRSTFYAHFETKDELLHSICKEIFGHIFSDVLNAEEHHDFSKENITLSDKLTHLLYHLKEQKNDTITILSGESSDLFLQYFKTYLKQLFAEHVPSAPPAVPRDFMLNHYASSFADAVKWWTDSRMKTSPEKVTEYYMTLTKTP